MPDGFIAVSWELPTRDGLYEICGMIGGVSVTLYDSTREAFALVPGIIGIVGWREYVPDAEDLAEFRLRVRCCYPSV